MSLAAGSRRRAVAVPTTVQAQAVDDIPAVDVVYVGLITRALAFAIDAVAINAVAIIVAAVVALFFSIMSLPHDLRVVAAAVGAGLYVLWSVGYFVTFWATTGQTPGCRAMRIRVRPVSGPRMKPRRALVRFVGLWIAAIPLFTGFVLILFNDRRRGLHDVLARTVVVEAPPQEDPPAANARRRPTGQHAGHGSTAAGPS